VHLTPVALLNCPAPQDVHLALPFESENCPAAHKEQLVDCGVSLTLPIAHMWQDCMPVSLPNLPGMHGKQNDFSISG
jgi:hypothetical protein